jgi:hypothetical protein
MSRHKAPSLSLIVRLLTRQCQPPPNTHLIGGEIVRVAKIATVWWNCEGEADRKSLLNSEQWAVPLAEFPVVVVWLILPRVPGFEDRGGEAELLCGLFCVHGVVILSKD